MNRLFISIIATVALMTGGCRSTAPVDASASSIDTPVRVNGSAPRSVTAIPKAVIYRTNGDFNNLVPVTMTPSGKSLLSYPAPSDINGSQLPLQLIDGYLLDRRGISAYTAFTKFTYSEYSALPFTPSAKELKDAILPGAEVTEIVRLPITAMAAASDTALCNDYIRNHFADCEIILQRKAVQLTPQ